MDVEFINEFTFNLPEAKVEPINEVIEESTHMYWGSEPIETKKSNEVAESSIPQLSAEERRQQVRDSWLKRFDKNATI